MGNILEIKNLVCGYDGKEVIKDVSFSVQSASFTGIIGPNGAGKTTLLKSISRIIRPSRGEIYFQGRDIFDFKIKELARAVAVIPQSLQIPFSFTVEEFVNMGRFSRLGRFQRFGRYDREAVAGALFLTDTLELKERKINELSEGEKQRVIIAQGLAQEPQLLLLDEPTSHLDITHQVQILNLLKHLSVQNNLTVLIVLHDLNLASEFCKELILLHHGRIHKEGRPQEVLTYQNIEDVYKTLVIVKENPLSHKPYVFLVPKEIKAVR